MITPTQSHPAEMAHTPDLYYSLVALLRWAEYQHAENVKEGVQDANAIPPCIVDARKAVRIEKETKAIYTACNSHHAQQAAIRQLREALDKTSKALLSAMDRLESARMRADAATYAPVYHEARAIIKEVAP